MTFLKWFQSVLGSTSEGMLVLSAVGEVLACNRAGARVFGYGPEEITGKDVGLLAPPGQRGDPGEDISGFLGMTGATGIRDLSGLHRRGTTFPLEMASSEFTVDGERRFLILVRDVTLRRLTEDALQEAEERLSDITANLPVVVFQRVMTTDGAIYYPYVSPSVADLLGIDLDSVMADPEALLGKAHPEDRERVLWAVRRSAETLKPMDEEYRILRADGEVRWLRGVARPRTLENGDVMWDGVTLDVTSQKGAAEHLRRLAFNDPLTGTLNRAGFEESLDKARAEAGVHGNQMAILMVGLDRFGLINDTMGHATGDEVVKAVCKRIGDCLDPSNVIARPSGDIFAVLINPLKAGEDVHGTVERILAQLDEPFEVRGRRLDVKASCGVSFYPKDGEDSGALLKNSGTALRRAKEAGRGGYQFFQEEMNSRVLQVMVLEGQLREALQNEEFIPYFQAQVDMKTGRVVGMEALARWRHGKLGIMVSPGEFIQAAEDSGLIGDIGQMILRRSCIQNKAWQDEGLRPVSVAVNISGRQFSQPRRLMASVEAALAESGMDAKWLELELTESFLMENPEEGIKVLDKFHDLGVATAIDDFGTGYSSLSYLKRFPIDKLKIDRSFVMDLTVDADDAAIVSAIIAMAKALRLKVVAEGVEEVGQLNYLRDQGCDQIQGFLFSPPLPAEEMGNLLRQDRRLPVGK